MVLRVLRVSAASRANRASRAILALGGLRVLRVRPGLLDLRAPGVKLVQPAQPGKQALRASRAKPDPRAILALRVSAVPRGRREKLVPLALRVFRGLKATRVTQEPPALLEKTARTAKTEHPAPLAPKVPRAYRVLPVPQVHRGLPTR